MIAADPHSGRVRTMAPTGRTAVRRLLMTATAIAVTAIAAQPAAAGSFGPCPAGTKRADGGDVCVSRTDPRGAKALREVRRVRDVQKTRATMFGVWAGGRLLAQGAIGPSLTGVPATRDMHFRIGNTTEVFLTTLLLQLVDRHRIRLSDKVSRWYPDVPDADRITVDMLARSISGLPDYVTMSPFVDANNADPFRHWTAKELNGYLTGTTPLFTPGTSWAFSDSNFVLLGRILRRVGGAPVASQLRRRILGPLGLHQTRMRANGEVQSPALHAFSGERGVYEDATFWDASWTTYTADMTSDLDDMGVWARAFGRGTLLSRASARRQTGPQNVGLGPLTKARYYAMGVAVVGGWVVANPQLQGFNGIVANLPSRDLTVVISSTQTPQNSPTTTYSVYFFRRIAKMLTGIEPDLPANPRPHG